jgi:very-short-patch-repair endonuclease
MQRHRLEDVRHRRLAKLAAGQGGVVSRRQAYGLGVTRWEVRAHVRARRWQTLGEQSLVLQTGPVSYLGSMWAAVFQGGPRAHLDGATALVASGLTRFDAPKIRVTVPRGAKVRRTPLFDIRQTRRWNAETLASSGIPRTRPAVAAVRGALWAKSDKQATLILTMAVQQGLTTAEELSEAALAIRRDRRRRLLYEVILDLLGGVRSLGELDFAKECRRRRLPEPSRQVLRRDGAKHYYLDVFWDDLGLVVEIDGIQHSWAENLVGDALRQNSVSLQGLTVLRLPLLGLRTQPDAFFAQIEQAIRDARSPLAG